MKIILTSSYSAMSFLNTSTSIPHTDTGSEKKRAGMVSSKVTSFPPPKPRLRRISSGSGCKTAASEDGLSKLKRINKNSLFQQKKKNSHLSVNTTYGDI